MKSLFNLILSKPIFARVLFAMFISGLGTAFTSVAVYEQLSERAQGPFAFSLAYACGLLPGVLSSYFAGRYYKRWSLGKVLILAQVAGFAMLLFPLVGSFNGSIALLLMAEVTASVVSGLLIPIYKTIERSSFSGDQLPKLAVLDTFLLTANFICGQGLGSLLASVLSFRNFLLVDAGSYLLAVFILLRVSRFDRVDDSPPVMQTDWQNYRQLTAQKKNSLWLIPWLAAVCAPLMVLLPARGSEFAELKLFGFIAMMPALLLICSRTIGQLLGPMIAGCFDIPSISKRQMSLALALFIYILLYIGAYKTPSLYIACAFCILAHICSNIVYTVGNYQMMKEFAAEDIGWAFGFAYRFVTVIVAVVGLVSGVLAENFGLSFALTISFIMWIFGAAFFMNKERKKCLK